jgi:type I restriction enzyme, S subunit
MVLLKKMKNNWQIKKLGEICEIKTGKKDVNQGNPNGKYPFFTCAREHTFSDEYSFDTEALLVAGNGDVGHVSYYKGKFEAYQRTYVLYKFKDVLPRYLFLFLDGFLKDTVSKQKLGNTMPYIKMGMLADFEVPVPSLVEQKRIVKILDKNFKALEKVKENTGNNLQNSKELFESYLSDFFSSPKKDWEEKELGEFIKLEYGKPLPDSKRKIDGKYPVYGANGEKGRTNEFYFSKPSIIVGRKGTAGALNLVEERFWPLDVTYFVTFDNKKFSLQFIYYLLSFLSLSKFAKGVKPGINRNEVYSIKVNTPKLIQEQKRIVEKLTRLSEQTKKLEVIYKKKLVDLAELKKSILKKNLQGSFNVV